MPVSGQTFDIMAIIILAIFSIVAIANIINPKWVWQKTESWKATKEPSAGFFMLRRIFGVAMLIIAAYFCYKRFFWSPPFF